MSIELDSSVSASLKKPIAQKQTNITTIYSDNWNGNNLQMILKYKVGMLGWGDLLV